MFSRPKSPKMMRPAALRYSASLEDPDSRHGWVLGSPPTNSKNPLQTLEHSSYFPGALVRPTSPSTSKRVHRLLFILLRGLPCTRQSDLFCSSSSTNFPQCLKKVLNAFYSLLFCFSLTVNRFDFHGVPAIAHTPSPPQFLLKKQKQNKYSLHCCLI